MKPFLFIVFCLIAPLAYSQTVPVFNIPAVLEHQKDEKLSVVGSKLQYVHLETTPSCIMSEISKIIVDDNIYVRTKEGLFVFSLDGKFLRKIGRYGKGPTEFLSIIDFDVNKDNIWTLDVLQHKVFKFKKDGSFVTNYKYVSSIDKLIVTNSNYHLISTTPPEFWGNEDPGALIFVYSLEGKPLPSIKNMNPKNPSACVNAYKFNDHIYYRPTLTDTVWSLNSNKKLPGYVIDLGKYKPMKAMYNKNEKVKTINCREMAETDQSVFLSIREVDNTISNLSYNKTKKTLMNVEKPGFVNDLDNGMAFWPDFVCNNKLIKVLYYTDVKSYLDENKSSATFREKIGKIDMDANPILMVVSQ